MIRMMTDLPPSGAALARFKAEFWDRETERAYQKQFLNKQKKTLYAVVFAVLLIDLSSFVIDFRNTPEALLTLNVFLSRVGIVILELAFLATAFMRHNDMLFNVLVKLMTLAFLAQLLSLFHFHHDYGFIGPITYVCTIFTLYLILPFRWREQLVISIGFSILGLLIIGQNLQDPANFYRLLQWSIFANMIGIFVSWQRNMAMRDLYHVNQSLQASVALSRAALERNNRVSDILTHELRNPLSGILARSEQLTKNASGDVQKFAQQIAALVRLSSALIESWLDSDRTTMRSMNIKQDEVCNLSNLLDIIFSQFLGENPDAKLQPIPKTPSPIIACEAKVITLVIQNILHNATKYGVSQDGVLSVGVKYRMGRDHVVLRIRDFGAGIPFNVQSDIFTKHFRAPGHQESNNGRGIGLYICRQMMRSQGGDLELQSRPGYGAAFCVKIPLA